MNPNEYSADNFIKDEFFQRWVFSPDVETEDYWRSFLLSNPDKRDAIEEARMFLQVFTVNEADILESRISNLKKRIDLTLDQGNHAGSGEEKAATPSSASASFKNVPFHKKRLFFRLAVAASITFLLVAAAFLIPQTSLGTFFSTQEQITQKGQRSVITLEDGTKVWLNSDSRLSYPKHFSGKPTRDVYLDGEAFFEVKRNENQPFIVHTSDINIKVLGTSFNVRSYTNQRNIETTLVEGKVVIEPRSGNIKQMTLLPNQQAVYQKQTRELVLEQQVNTEKHTGWKEGNLNFDNVPLGEIIDVLERWYNVTIHLPGRGELNCRFSAKIENKSLEEVLELFEASDGIGYEIKGTEVYIRGQLCHEQEE